MNLRIGLALLAFVTAISLAQGQTASLKSEPSNETVAGKLVVKLTRQAFQQGATTALFGDATSRYGIGELKPWLEPSLVQYSLPRYKMIPNGTPRMGAEPSEISLERIMQIEFTAPSSPEEVAHALERIPGVEYAEPVYQRHILFTPNDPEISRQWYLDALKIKEAWDVVRADSSIIVAIVDTGIEKEHEDLQNAIWKNWGEFGPDGNGGDKQSNGKDDDGNGFIDDWWGYDFSGSDGITPDNDPSSACSWHGTHVAGVVGASGNNETGIAGVAFGVKLMAVKITDNSCNDPSLAGSFDGLLYAAKMGAQIINCSWGGTGRSRAEQEVINVATGTYGAVVIAAAGNNKEETKFYPAAYDGVIAVAAVDQADKRASYSNYYYRVNISAPGSSIYSTRTYGGYEYDSGTSMAAPIVSGTAALLLARYPGLTAAEVREILLASTDNIESSLGPQFAEKMGAGRLNVLHAVSGGRELASARMTAYKVIDENGDGLLDPGEKVQIRADITNILAPASEVTVLLESVSHPAIDISGSLFELGAMATGQTLPSPDNTFQFTVPANVQPNDVIVLRLSVQTQSRINRDYLELTVTPSWMTTNYNTIASTFNSVGNIAFDGLNRKQGEGFSFGTNSGLLYHGGLMIGTSSEMVDDVVRVGGLSQGVNDGFRMTKPYRLSTTEDSSAQIGTARFDDSHRNPLVQIGLDVEMKTVEYRDPSLANSVTVVYRIHNTTSALLTNLHCGLYLDWDISPSSATDIAAYDGVNRLGYAYDSGNENSLFAGASLLSPHDVNYYAINNDNFDDGITTDFAIDKKWRFMSGGIARNETQIGDVSMVIAGGPISIPAGDYVDVAFALAAANNLNGLKQAVGTAREKYLGTLGVVEIADNGSPMQLRITPNPFSDDARVSFTMKHSGYASLVLYDMQGRPVTTLIDRTIPAGDHTVNINADELVQGMYVYELRTADGVARGKVLRIGK